MNSLQESAWLAGILDAEGWFTARSTGGSVSYQMTDLDLVLRGQGIEPTKCSTYVVRKQGRKVQYQTRWGANEAQNVMKRVYPFMGTRRKIKIDSMVSATSPDASITLTQACGDCWLAGLLDGEANFRARQDKRWPQSRPNLAVTLKMTDLDLVEKARDIMCGSTKIAVSRPPSLPNHCKTAYIISWYGQPAENVMRRVHYYMGERRKKEIDRCLNKDLGHLPKRKGGQ